MRGGWAEVIQQKSATQKKTSWKIFISQYGCRAELAWLASDDRSLEDVRIERDSSKISLGIDVDTSEILPPGTRLGMLSPGCFSAPAMVAPAMDFIVGEQTK